MRLPRGVVRAAMRARDRIPETTWPIVLQLASLAGSELPVIGLPDVRRVLVVAPHPDDETIGCGGTMALMADAGTAITVVVATDGEATIGSPHDQPGTGERRRAEAAAACAVLGVDAPVHLALPDGGLAVDGSTRLREALGEVVEQVDPEVVFCPWPMDRHRDHRACARVVGEVVADHVEVWGYEAHVATTPNRAVDITSVVERKRSALAAHVTAGFAMDLQATLGLNRWRSLPVNGGQGYAEVFLALAAPRWRQAVELAAALA